MSRQDRSTKLARRRAAWLPRLADPATVQEAAEALWQIDSDCDSGGAERPPRTRDLTREQEDALEVAAYAPAIEAIAGQLDALIPAWVARLVEEVSRSVVNAARWSAALKAGEAPPDMPVGSIFAIGELTKALQATGERIDPHVGPIVDAIGAVDRDADEHLAAALEYAGPAVVAAVPKLLGLLRERGVWCWPSHLARALANASRFDPRVLAGVRELLSSDDDHLRSSAISVLGALGPAARAASDQLMAFRRGSEDERCGMIHALARQGPPAPEFLDLLDEAMRDANGYVRRSAARVLGELTPDPGRFVPLLVAACDWAGYLHDESLPAAAVDALRRYGPRAAAALPRLREFIDGPIKGRVVSKDRVFDAMRHIAPGAGTPAPGTDISVRDPVVREAPADGDDDDDADPLFGVTHEGRRCYVDRAGRLALRTRFPRGRPFSDGRAVMEDDDRDDVVIDRRGREVFRSEWDEIRPYSEGLAAVAKDDKWGFVDRDGRVVIGLQYDSVTPFSEGLAGIETGRTEERGPGRTRRVNPGRRGFIDRTGAVVIAPVWTEASSFRGGRAVVCTGGTMKPNPVIPGREDLYDRTFGYIDYAGQLVIPGRYATAEAFAEGLAVVTRPGRGRFPERYGYVDASGAVALPLKFTWASAFSEGLAVVRRRGKRRRGHHFVIDRAGRTVAELPHQFVGSFSHGLAPAAGPDAWGYVGRDGRWAVEPQFDNCRAFRHGLAEVQRGDWYGLIDPRGNFVWGPTTEGGINTVIEPEWT